MKLYYSKGACSLSVRILIHELQLSCEFEAVNLQTKQTETHGNFLEVNPKGAVPVLVLDNKEILTENVAIQQYLADQYSNTLLAPIPQLTRYHILEWLSYISSDLHKSFGPLFNPNIPQTIKDNIFKPNLINKLNFLDTHFKNNIYLVGNELTLPDPYLFTVLRWLSHFSIHISDWKNLNKYFQTMQERKAVQKALMEEGLLVRTKV